MSSPRSLPPRLVLLGAVLGAALVAGVPRRPASEAERQATRARLRERLAAGQVRGGIDQFLRERGRLPGLEPGPALLPGADGASWVADLTGPRGPLGRIPLNPRNGLDSVWVLEDGDARPPDTTIQCGWIFDPRSGELWAAGGPQAPLASRNP